MYMYNLRMGNPAHVFNNIIYIFEKKNNFCGETLSAGRKFVHMLAPSYIPWHLILYVLRHVGILRQTAVN